MRWQLLLGIGPVALSACFYFIHDLVFVDIKRVYVMMVKEWLAYMEYLRSNYPYLFSHAMRTNHFDRDASPVVL